MLIGNLLDNALRYTPAGGRIDVAIDRNGRAARPVGDRHRARASRLPNVSACSSASTAARHRGRRAAVPAAASGCRSCAASPMPTAPRSTLDEGPDGRGLAVRVRFPPRRPSTPYSFTGSPEDLPGVSQFMNARPSLSRCRCAAAVTRCALACACRRRAHLRARQLRRVSATPRPRQLRRTIDARSSACRSSSGHRRDAALAAARTPIAKAGADDEGARARAICASVAPIYRITRRAKWMRCRCTTCSASPDGGAIVRVSAIGSTASKYSASRSTCCSTRAASWSRSAAS